jgi:IMP cyclohydrolase
MSRKKGVVALNSIAAKKRIVETAALLLNLKSRRYIIDTLVAEYHIQPRSCDAIITNAYEYIKDNYKTDRASIVIKHLEFYYDLAVQWKDVDGRVSLKALEQIERLLKLHQDVPLIQQNTLNMNFEKINTEQLMKAIESITGAKKNV